MQFVDFFAGIGGVRLGLEQAGHKCIGFCEFDKFARQSYKAMYDTSGEWESNDIRAVKPYDVPRADLWTFGFPCQDVSIAGKQKGLQCGERSGLFYEVMRLLSGLRQEDRPKWLLIENVKNLLAVGRGFDFARVLTEVGGYGYSCEWQLINSKDYGVPQNRERVFIVGHHGDVCGRKIFPVSSTDGKNPCRLHEITRGQSIANRVYSVDGISKTLAAVGGGGGAKTGLYLVNETQKDKTAKDMPKVIGGVGEKTFGKQYNQGNRVYDAEHISPALSSQSGNASNGSVIVGGTGIVIRRLTPRECFRLQGFNDKHFDRAKAAGVSDTQLYKQAGNAVTVNVAKAIGDRLKEIENS